MATILPQIPATPFPVAPCSHRGKPGTCPGSMGRGSQGLPIFREGKTKQKPTSFSARPRAGVGTPFPRQPWLPRGTAAGGVLLGRLLQARAAPTLVRAWAALGRAERAGEPGGAAGRAAAGGSQQCFMDGRRR